MIYRNSNILNDAGVAKVELIETSEGIMAYRVPEDAEKAIYLVDVYGGCSVKIKAADHVFGGKDLVINTENGQCAVYLELNTYIQRSGEHKGCVLIENDDIADCSFIILE